MSFEIKHTNSDFVKNIKKQLKSAQVKVGLPKGKGGSYEDGSSVIEVGSWHEFGTDKIPERSFIRVPVQQNMQKYKSLAQKEVKKIYEGKQTVDGALGILGLFMSDRMKASFTDNDWAENSPFTVALKGSSTPLIDTGQLRQSITWQVAKPK